VSLPLVVEPTMVDGVAWLPSGGPVGLAGTRSSLREVLGVAPGDPVDVEIESEGGAA
jgi:NADH-quinone oxidoreductase subunit G